MKILDCTLRDGGYYTNWDFNQPLVDAYLHAMEVLPVDIIEIGYRSNPQKGYLGEYFYLPSDTLKYIRKSAPGKKIAIMFNEKDISVADSFKLLAPVQGLVDIVRLAVNPTRLDQAIVLSRAIKEQGFEVALNLMYMSKLVQDLSVVEKLPGLNGIVNYFSLVDSYGGVYPDDVRRIVKLVKPLLQMEIGFHGHNNMELAFANSMAALDEGCSIVDCTVTGMGRGAGNLKTELLLTWLSAKRGLKVDFNALSDLVAGFEELQSAYGWGTNLPYMVSGASSLPQQDVMDWVTKRTYSMNSIVRALQNQQMGNEDNLRLPVLNGGEHYDKALLIAGGPNGVTHANAIKKWVEKNKEGLVVIHVSSRNVKTYEDLHVPQIYCLVGNEGRRLEHVFRNLNRVNGRCLLPAYPRKMGTYVPAEMQKDTYELAGITFTDRYSDSHTAVSLQAAINFNAKEVYAVGFDGYSGAVIGEKEKDLLKENEYLLAKFTANFHPVVSLTPSQYTNLLPGTVYSEIDD